MAFVMRVKLNETLRDGTFKNYYDAGRKNGYQVDVRLAYYRGHYLSVITQLGIEVDGVPAPKEDIKFCVNGKKFDVDQLKEAYSEFWSIKEPATIMVRRPGGLPEGNHHVKLTLMLQSPYLPLPGSEDKYTPIDSCDEKDMELIDSPK